MSEDISVPVDADKEEKYIALLPQLRALVDGEPDSIANVANIMAALKYAMNFFWVGIYFVQKNSEKEELVLGPFQGPVACTRIAFGKGVCGTAWQDGKTIIVEDVDKFPGHISCNSLSRSEIVIPVFKDNKICAVIDVDSINVSDFDSVDRKYLEQVSVLLAQLL
ncbi:MAG: GAF domain-containing protein [Bacteroidetes bacterium]|nr:MAG: GAF domain-containing protein [Bacteroidota bacterium]